MSTPAQVDPRGLRVNATLTAVVLALILVLPREVATVLLAVQVVMFAVSVFVGLSASPYAQFFARVVRPRIGPPEHTEDARPPRFAQVVGLVFTAAGLIALLLGATIGGATLVGYVLVAFALVAALLNASIGLCLGCEMYLSYNKIIAARPS